MNDWSKLIFDTGISFDEKARRVFEYQFEFNPVFRRYCEALDPEISKRVRDDIGVIPLLPIKAFKDA
ncbi:MAG: hypothetical protein PVH63_10380, partial [Balneolaceae bacterium]